VAEAVAEPKTPAKPRATSAKGAGTSAARKPSATASAPKRTPDPVRSAAAKAAAARRKAAKEAAAAAALLEDQTSVADTSAAVTSAAATSPTDTSATDTSASKGDDAPAGTEALPVVATTVPPAVATDAELTTEAAPEPVTSSPRAVVSARPSAPGGVEERSTAPAHDDAALTAHAVPPLPDISAEEAAASFALEAERSTASGSREATAPGSRGASDATLDGSAHPGRPRLGDRLVRALVRRRRGTSVDSHTGIPDASIADAGTDVTISDGASSAVTSGAATGGALTGISDTVAVDAIAPAPETVSALENPDAGTVEPAPVSETEDHGADVPRDSAAVLTVRGLRKTFGDTHAVESISLDVRAGSFYGIVGPNGAGKTTTLSMISGLLRPDAGTVTVNGIDVWADPTAAKRTIGVLPDRLRVFDRLTGAQLLYYAGTLRRIPGDVVRRRVDDLARAFGLEDAMGRLVSDYSAGMVKKVSLAAAMIHSPRVLILDEPFESVDPVSAAKVVEILRSYVDNGGTVVLSSHSMDFIQRVCDHVAIIVEGHVLAAGPVEEVRGPVTLEERFLELAGGRKAAEGMEWLHSFSG
jgi:ABC-2 type transport system ATP-binding protein